MTLRVLVVCCALAPGLALAVSEDEARAAYEQKDYAACAQVYGRLASAASGDDKAGQLYNQACCLALAGKTDDALTAVEQSAALDVDGAEAMKKDDDLKSLRTLPRWVAVMKRVDAQLAAARKTQNVALSKELVSMTERDQAVRNAAIATGLVPGSKEALEMVKVDLQNGVRLKQIVAKYGWPGRKLVGKRAAHGAWLLVQHATDDKPFMEKCLALMQAAKDDVSTVDTAYLEDRVRTMQGKKQLYGTQFEGTGADVKAMPIEDPEHVDERRRALGLGTLEQARADIVRMYSPGAVQAPPPDAGR